MATISKIDQIGRDRRGRWLPGYLTHAELVGELEAGTSDRQAELVGEAKSRTEYSDYPPFPPHLQEVLK